MSALQKEKEGNRALTVVNNSNGPQADSSSGATSVQDDPRLTAAVELDATELQDAVNLARRFHLGEPGAVASTTPPDETHLPLSLNGFRSLRLFRYEYPLLLLPDNSGELLAKPLDEFLKDALPESEGSARILKDNMVWLEAHIRNQISGQDFATPARDLVIEGGKALREQISLNESEKETLKADIDELIASVPMGSHFLPYTHNVALYLLQHTIRHRTQWQREQMMRRITQAIRGLQQLVEIEEEKKGQGEIAGEGSRYFKDSSMEGVLENRSQGSVLMSVDRIERIKATIEILTGYEMGESILHLVVRPGSFSIGDTNSIDIIESDDPCVKALEIHDQVANTLSKVFASLRVAELDIADGYDARFHDSWFESFNADAFNDDEKQMIPTVVALETAEHATDDSMQSFSRILSSGKPVQILINIDPHINPGQESDLVGGLRTELAYLGVAHRHAVINQMSAAKYESLLSGFSSALGSHQACLHLIHTGFTEPQPLHPWIMASAALESRAHPVMKFDPTDTDVAADKTFAGNPGVEDNWATNTVSYINDKDETVEEEMAFTFADYCLLKPELLDHFRFAPEGCVTDDLVSVAEFLDAEPDNQNRMIPFVWSVDQEGLMHRLVVSRRLLFACLDRLNFWRTLQSLSGVKNAHIDEAVRKAREEEQQLAISEREELTREHEEVLQNSIAESASEITGRLTNILMELDLTSDAPIAAPAATPVETPAAGAVAEESETAELSEPEAAAPEVVEEEEDEVSFDEPWIDSIFCTTCDDCLVLNKQMFVYNDNRQAIISDPKLGTYLQLVEAAELCPARCIHPGKPLDSSEAGLDDLIARAEPYN